MFNLDSPLFPQIEEKMKGFRNEIKAEIEKDLKNKKTDSAEEARLRKGLDFLEGKLKEIEDKVEATVCKKTPASEHPVKQKDFDNLQTSLEKIAEETRFFGNGVRLPDEVSHSDNTKMYFCHANKTLYLRDMGTWIPVNGTQGAPEIQFIESTPQISGVTQEDLARSEARSIHWNIVAVGICSALIGGLLIPQGFFENATLDYYAPLGVGGGIFVIEM